MDKHRAASEEAWSTFLRSRFETCARARFKDFAVGRADLADLELAVMEGRVIYARQQRNKVMGACRLPPEILSKVFTHAQEDWSPALQGKDRIFDNGQDRVIRARYSSGWMNLLHVCSSWRQTALGSPSLWCNISCMDVHPDSVPTLLARSRGLPLSLSINGASLSFNDGDDLQAQLSWLWLSKPALRRTRRLVLDNVPDHRLHQWLRNLLHPMPLLETFKVNNSRRERPDITATLPADLFACNAPVLRSVSLSQTILPSDWGCVLFSHNLVDLSLGFDASSPRDVVLASAPTSQSFYRSILSMKALRSLTLRNIFPALPQGEHPPIEANVKLPNLKDLTLASVTSELVGRCLDFFHRLIIPAQTRVILEVVAEDDFNFDDRLPIHIVKLFAHSEATTPSTMYLSQHAISTTYTSPSPQAILRTQIPREPAYTWAEYNLGAGARGLLIRQWATVLPHFQLLPLQSLQTMVFTSDFSDAEELLTPEGWTHTMAFAQNVRNISVHYFDALVLLDALCEPGTEPSIPFLLFPRLLTIALHATEYVKHPDETYVEMGASLEVLLLDMLRVRQERGAPVATLLVSERFAGWDVWGRVEELAHVEFF
ncbi:hypothetical protein PENSPDRAFT_757981 [Peniophora sp. CONT]|nr:hypothetical protein PENSPDRAFT_757981 [Peniophora sp. CONT]